MKTLEKPTQKMNQIIFKIKSVDNFTSFLKKFTPIEKGLLLEITPTYLRAVSHTVDKGILKASQIDMDNVLEGTFSAKLIKIGLFDVGRIIDLFKHFDSSDDLSFELNYNEVNNEFLGSSLRFISSKLVFKIKCADVDLFTYLSPKLINDISGDIESNKMVDFSFPKEYFTKISSLCNFDKGEDKLNILINKGKILFRGESFDYELGDTNIKERFDVSFLKIRFSSIDEENSNFILSKDKILINSIESNTQTMIGRVQ